METRANYILIGVFALFGILGTLGFFVWLAKVEVDRQYAHYDILFESVSGLDRAADVQFNGLSVGRVISLDLYPDDPSKVIVRIEIASETPIKTDTKAQMQSQGLTGVAFVSLAGGSPQAALLRDTAGTEVSIIEAERSMVQTLTAEAPDLIAEAVNLMRQLEVLTNEKNQAHFANILENIEETTELLPPLASQTETTMAAAAQTLERIDTAMVDLEDAIDAIETTFQSANEAFERANSILDDDAAPAIADMRSAAAQFEEAMRGIAEDIPDISAELTAALDTASAAVDQINETVSAIGPPFQSFVEDGLPQYARLARETRDLVDNLQRLTARIQRDPARFFFGSNVPEFRR
ncbi:MlaD family protein [Yoonia maritima]|uniref:MlaD family protein n=1 Tax=Yoonia maritima TaxID=1435347 RepID=UPI00373614C3